MFWFEYGGRKIGTLNLSIIDVNQMKLKLNHQQEDSDCSDPVAMDLAKNGNFYPWKAVGRYRDEFSPHQSVVFNVDTCNIHIMGGNGNK